MDSYFTSAPDPFERYEENEPFKYCPKCSQPMDWIECDNCDDEDYTDHDCGEDCCCCLDPEPNVSCDICDGNSGWWHCFNEQCPGKQETK